MCQDRRPVHLHPLSHNSRIMVQPTLVVEQKNFVAFFPSQFRHGYEMGRSFGVPDQWLFEAGWVMLERITTLPPSHLVVKSPYNNFKPPAQTCCGDSSVAEHQLHAPWTWVQLLVQEPR